MALVFNKHVLRTAVIRTLVFLMVGYAVLLMLGKIGKDSPTRADSLQEQKTPAQ